MNARTAHLPKLPGAAPRHAAILTGIIVMIALAILTQGFMGYAATPEQPEIATEPPAVSKAMRPHRCSDCGVIQSTRDMGKQGTWQNASAPGAGDLDANDQRAPARNHEITVRLTDGSMRVVQDADAAIWRTGERISIIAGTE